MEHLLIPNTQSPTTISSVRIGVEDFFITREVRRGLSSRVEEEPARRCFDLYFVVSSISYVAIFNLNSHQKLNIVQH